MYKRGKRSDFAAAKCHLDINHAWQNCVLLLQRPIMQLRRATEPSKTFAKVCIITSMAGFAASKCHLLVNNVYENVCYCVSCIFCNFQVRSCRQKRSAEMCIIA